MLRPIWRWTLGVALLGVISTGLEAQQGTAGEPDVIQIVTFRFAPGQASRAIAMFRDLALPLYEQDEAMLEFRAYREVESPVALDLVVISHFRGMAGMDRSNARLREVATASGSSIGAVYGGIGELSVGHTDEFVEIEVGSSLGSMDSSRLVVLEYLEAGGAPHSGLVGAPMLPTDVSGVTGGIGGAILIADGWSHFRMYGAESLGAVHLAARSASMRLVDGHAPVSRRRRIVLAPVPELSVR